MSTQDMNPRELLEKLLEEADAEYQIVRKRLARKLIIIVILTSIFLIGLGYFLGKIT